MKKLITKLTLATLVLCGYALASDNLLTSATNGYVSPDKAVESQLNDTEMKNIVGGDYIYRDTNIAWGAAQVIGKITESYDGDSYWLVGEKYGKDWESGYKIFLAYRHGDSLPGFKHTEKGYVYNVKPVPITSRELSMLSYKYVRNVKERLEGLVPGYLR
ncbi:hypothetical protein [Campylobacter sp. RM16188]|uniref:hypothetical protein n=1 Tax=Campylobacter sp. RM16188 TaxID=1705725 RepID=UPI0015546862|nr:hypothetical protein [Campylobacter sp. RM16188]